MDKTKSQGRANFIITKLARFFSIRIALLIKKYNITPNQVTVASFAIGIAAFLSFSIGTWAFNILGTLLFLASFQLDFVDGDLARLKNQTSQFGEWLDAITGKIESVLLFLGICIGQAGHHPPALVWFLGFITISGYYVSQSLMYKKLILSYKRKLNTSNKILNGINGEVIAIKKKSILKKVISEFFNGGIFVVYAIIICAILDKMLLFLWLTAIYMWLDHIIQIYFNSKRFKKYAY